MVLALTLGAGIGVLGLLSTGRSTLGTAARAAALFEEAGTGAMTSPTPASRRGHRSSGGRTR